LTGYLVRTVGATAYGFFTLACTMVGYATLISNALNSMSSRFVGYEYFNGNIKQAIKYYSSVLYGDIAFVAIISIPGIILLFNIESFIDIPPELVSDVKILFFIVFANLCVSVVGSIFSIVYVITDRLDLSSIREVVSNIIRAGLLFLLYSAFPVSIVYLGIASLVTTIYVLVVNIMASRRLIPQIKADYRMASVRAIKEITMSGMWNTLNQLSIILLHGLDLLICNKMVSPLAMGYFSVAVTLPNAVSSCVSSFAYLFTPRFLEHFSKSEFQELKNDVRNSIKFMTVISCIPISFLIGFGLPFYQLWTPNTDVVTVYILSVCIILPNFTGSAIHSVNYLYSTANKVKWPAIVLLITGILNVGLIFLLLKTTDWGVMSIVVVSAALGFIRNIVFNAPYAAKCIKQKYNVFYRDMLTSFVLLAASCSICWMVCQVARIDSWFSLIAIGGISSCAMALSVAMIILTPHQRQFLLMKIFKR